MVVATFEHSTSRELDPHLHTHAIVANVAPRFDGSWGTIDSRSIMLWQKAAGMIYKLSLAESLRSMGFQTEIDGDSFKVAGIPQSICDHFSKRSNQITDALKERGIKQRASTAGDIASLSTRENKGEINRKSLFGDWQKQLSALGFTSNEFEKLKKIEKSELAINPVDAKSLADSLTESNSTFTQQEIYFRGGIQALENNQSLTSFRSIADELMQDADTIDLGRDWKHSQQFTTAEVVSTEKSLISHAKKLGNTLWITVPSHTLDSCIQAQQIILSEEQQFAVRNACTESQLAIIQGSAGSGKSASMMCVRDVYQSLGKRVVGASIARSASKNVEKEAGIDTFTIARLLAWLETDKPPVKKGDVLIVDEAGQVGTFYLEQLMKHATEKDFKIVLVGEDKQLDAIDHGGALRYLSTPDLVGTTRVETIRRQNQAWDRQAVANFRDGYAHQALAQYEKRDQLHIELNEDAAKSSLIDAWTEYRQKQPERQSMVIAQSWTDVMELNNAMRSKLQLEGNVGKENISVKATVSARDIDVHLSIGERVRFTKNDYKRNYTNGDLGTVTKIQVMEDGDIWLRVRFDSGRETQFMTSSYANEDGRTYLTQAYAQTVYSSQGLTIDGDVFVYYTQNMDRAHSYVACSRHKNRAHIFANAQELEEDIPENFEHAPLEKGLREALASNMSRNSRPKLAIEHLSKKEVDNIICIQPLPIELQLFQ